MIQAEAVRVRAKRTRVVSLAGEKLKVLNKSSVLRM